MSRGTDRGFDVDDQRGHAHQPRRRRGRCRCKAKTRVAARDPGPRRNAAERPPGAARTAMTSDDARQLIETISSSSGSSASTGCGPSRMASRADRGPTSAGDQRSHRSPDREVRAPPLRVRRRPDTAIALARSTRSRLSASTSADCTPLQAAHARPQAGRVRRRQPERRPDVRRRGARRRRRHPRRAVRRPRRPAADEDHRGHRLAARGRLHRQRHQVPAAGQPQPRARRSGAVRAVPLPADRHRSGRK